jgi:hypothetical protein
MPTNGDPKDDVQLTAAAKAAEAYQKARTMALDDQRNEGGSPRAYTGNRMLPLNKARLLFEGFYNSYVKPNYLWSTVTDYPFLPAWPKPIDWDRKRDKVDSKGLPLLNSAGEPEWEYANDYRREYFPNAHFISATRFRQYEQGIIESGSAMYQCLWAIHIRQSRWDDPAVEAVIANDEFWQNRYLTDLAPLDDDEESGSVVTTGDGGTPPSSPGLASVEA